MIFLWPTFAFIDQNMNKQAYFFDISRPNHVSIMLYIIIDITELIGKSAIGVKEKFVFASICYF